MTSNTSFYRYIISAFDIIIPDMDPIKLGQANMMSLSIEKDFDNLYFPVMSIKLLVDYKLYYTIVKNKTTVKFRMKLEKYLYGSENPSKYKDVVFDTLFSAYIDDDTFFIDEAAYKRALSITDNTLSGGIIELYLFKESYMSASRKVLNRVISNANMTDTVTYLLSSCGCTDVLMSPFDNNTSYREVILLPTTLIQNLIYLEKQFGFYKNGSIIFFDFNNMYILNRKSTVTAYATNEYTTVGVTCYTTINSNSLSPGSYKDEKTKTYTIHISRDNIEIRTASLVAAQTSGTNITVVSGSDNKTTTVTPKIQMRTATEQVLVNNFENKYLASMIENAKVEQDSRILMNLVDIDTDTLAPNKRYHLTFEDVDVQSRHGGFYRLNKLTLRFEKKGEEFLLRASALMSKTL